MASRQDRQVHHKDECSSFFVIKTIVLFKPIRFYLWSKILCDRGPPVVLITSSLFAKLLCILAPKFLLKVLLFPF